MNKLGRKLSTSITVSVLLLFVMFIPLENLFIPKYYIYKSREQLNVAVHKVSELSEENWIEAIPELEQEYSVTIVYDKLRKPVDELNDSLKQQLANKRITLNKFWITEESLLRLKTNTRVNKIYDQGKLKSSFYTSFILKGDKIVLIGLSMAHIRDTIQIINEFYLLLALFLVLIIVLIVWILSYRMTKPLKELGQVAKDISELRFRKAIVHTHDEIEELAESINTMSDKLCAAHTDLSRRNANLKQFMSDMSHELKTPISLIQAYAEGIQDGLDDGSYATTILRQNHNMAKIIDEFLDFSKIERDELKLHPVDFKSMFHECSEKFHIELKSRQLKFLIHDKLPGHPVIEADPGKIRMVFDNLIGNAVKYAVGEQIDVHFREEYGEIVLTISNRFSGEIADPSQLWEPFYVEERSRYKAISGTGLGLAIVKTVLERHGFRYEVETEGQTIHFNIYFKRMSP